MLNGFYAKSFEEELPNKNMFVSFMVEQKDITDILKKKGIDNVLPSRLRTFLDSVENVMSKQVKAKDSTLRLEIKPYFEGNRFYATTYRDFTDLRLVFTVPKSMGKFGGETDNWMCHARHVTSRCSASMPTQRPTVRQNTAKTTCHIVRSHGLRCHFKAITTATLP